MKKVIKLLVFIFFVFGLEQYSFSQTDSLKIKILSAIGQKEKERVEMAKKYWAKGDQLIKRAKEIESVTGQTFISISDYLPERIYKLDKQTLGIVRESTKKKIEASKYFENYNSIMVSVYQTELMKLSKKALMPLKKKVMQIVTETSGYMIIARGKRDSTLGMGNEFLIYPQLMKASSIENTAMDSLVTAFNLFYNLSVFNIDENKNDEDKIISGGKEYVVFYKIQIAASKVTLSVKYLKKRYKIDETIGSDFEKGMYKYSIKKKFKTYEEATAYKNKLGAKGFFILAFINNTKVSVLDAIKLQKKQGAK